MNKSHADELMTPESIAIKFYLFVQSSQVPSQSYPEHTSYISFSKLGLYALYYLVLILFEDQR